MGNIFIVLSGHKSGHMVIAPESGDLLMQCILGLYPISQVVVIVVAKSSDDKVAASAVVVQSQQCGNGMLQVN